MSTQAVAQPMTQTASAKPWDLWRRQVAVILWMELRRNFITKRGFWIYLLALAPVALIWLHSFVEIARAGSSQHRMHRLSGDTEVMAAIFQFFWLRLAMFFGSVGIFTYLFRGEVLERSLHYYFLAPVKREVLVIGKFFAGLITSTFFFGASVTLGFIGMYIHFAPVDVQRYLFENGGVWHLIAYLSITVLACTGYGALFLWIGMRAKNPMVPAGIVFGWEAMNLFLPGWLKKISVIYYLKSLLPVNVSAGRRPNPISILAANPENPAPWVAVLGVLAFASVVLFLATRTAHRMEVSYSSD